MSHVTHFKFIRFVGAISLFGVSSSSLYATKSLQRRIEKSAEEGTGMFAPGYIPKSKYQERVIKATKETVAAKKAASAPSEPSSDSSSAEKKD